MTRATTIDAGRRSSTSVTFLADLVERIESLALDLLGHDHDVDAREVIGDRFAPRRLLPDVLLDRLLGGQVLDLGERALAQDELEDAERELRAVVVKPLALLAEQALLELAAALQHLLVHLAVVVALAARLFTLATRLLALASRLLAFGLDLRESLPRRRLLVIERVETSQKLLEVRQDLFPMTIDGTGVNLEPDGLVKFLRRAGSAPASSR